MKEEVAKLESRICMLERELQISLSECGYLKQELKRITEQRDQAKAECTNLRAELYKYQTKQG